MDTNKNLKKLLEKLPEILYQESEPIDLLELYFGRKNQKFLSSLNSNTGKDTSKSNFPKPKISISERTNPVCFLLPDIEINYNTDDLKSLHQIERNE